jgi:trans-aconitate methyltransferase
MNEMSVNQWNAELYDGKLGFVSEYGKSLIDLLQPQAGEQILDLGCGTGDLSNEIAQLGADVTGIDLAESMLEQAKRKYPHIPFLHENAETVRFTKQFDAVFSNAALHWMKNAKQVAESIWLALKPGGRFVAELGGKGNVETMVQALEEVLSTYGISGKERNPWYFPSIGEYSTLLEEQGFRVVYAVHFDRPTPLSDGENGLANWFKAFGGDFFQGISEEEQNQIIEQVKEKTRSALWKDGQWVADYKRLRVVAIKNG